MSADGPLPLAGCCGLVDPAMGESEAAQVAERFKALGDPTRVRMLNLLARNTELCVCDIQAHFDLAQPTISHHLSVLRRAGLVSSETKGRWAFYRADTETIAALGAVLEVER
ncbi:MAG TPA: metalloregulator ArsR/SmtB family transcription factor [Actinomycetota bacterium]|nr:metalloregulator ArsR/SmtB family transcription factor [Actinomycetota bacterium]